MELSVDQGEDEERRLAALAAYEVLDTDREPEFDDLVRLAAAVCRAPMAAVSLLDAERQWFKAETGVGARETPRDQAFCRYAISEPELMVVPDALADPRFADNPLVLGGPRIRFYAGAVLRTSAGEALGTVCVLDRAPRPQGLLPTEAELLRGVARQAMSLLELRRALKAERQERSERGSAEARLSAALEATEAVGAYVWDVKADRVYADPRFAGFYHVDPAEAAAGAPLESFVAAIEEVDRPAVEAAIRHALESGQPFEEEYRLKPPAGSARPRWVLARGRVTRDAGGEAERFSGAVVDITARKETEERSRATAVSLQVALRAARLGRWDHNPSTGARFYDERLQELFGLEPGEDRNFELTLSHLHPDDEQRLRGAIRTALDPERSGAFIETFRVRRRGGGWRWLEANGQTFFEFGRCTRFTGVMQDVTERVNAQREREEAALRLELALDAGGVGAWSFDPDTRTIRADSRSYELMGAPHGRPLEFGRDFMGRLHPEDRERALTAMTSAAEGDLYADELRVRLASGEDRWLAFRGRRSPGEREFIGTARDITAEKAMEAHRKLLADELRHRMKNLLAMVQSIAAQTLRTAKDREEASRIFAERLVALAGTVDMLSERTWSVTPMDSLVKAALGVHVAGGSRVEAAGPDVMLAPKPALALTLALHELATNAVKYGALSEPKGRVRLTWRIEADTLFIEWREEGGPPVSPPKRRSFGSRLIEVNVTQETGGKAKLAFEPTGVVWTVRAPLAGVTAG